MERNCQRYQDYVTILAEELVPAMGCTEPIAVAYAAARCRDLLAEAVDHCRLVVSGPIIKNVKSVVVPNTDGMKGLETSVAAGIVGGNAEAKLEVVASITKEQHAEIRTFIKEHQIEVVPADNDVPFFIDLTLWGAEHSARVVISTHHTNIVLTERDGATVFEKKEEGGQSFAVDHAVLNVADIFDFASTAALEDVAPYVRRQAECNRAISDAGLNEKWGAEVGKTLLSRGNDVRTRARAAAAAGSDARMSGCELPVVIVSGSGNQGITACMPVLEYAKELGSTEEQVMRALVLSDLIAVHIKTGIGRISAFCGAVCAGIGAACGVAMLEGQGLDAVESIIITACGICSGMVCDGAKPSCAAKISMSVEAGLLAYDMYKEDRRFHGGDGILKNDVEQTIRVVGEMASKGMRQTDRTILGIMVRPD